MIRWRKKHGQRTPRGHSHAQHDYPPGWRPNDWAVPFEDGEHACIHHGHDDPDDHSLCGPTIFCCAHAARLFVTHFPESCEACAEWQLTEAEHIATWMDSGVKVLYFVFCDPARADELLVIGLIGQHARDVLLKRVPLEQYAPEAQRLC